MKLQHPDIHSQDPWLFFASSDPSILQSRQMSESVHQCNTNGGHTNQSDT